MGRARHAAVSIDEPSGRGFSWWGPHDRARHSAELLLALVATICAAYVATMVAAVIVAVRIGQLGARHGLAKWQHQIGPLRIAGAVVAVVAALALLLAFLATEGLAIRATRLARAREPTGGEANHARRCIETFALGVGFASPTMHLIDDPAPNGFAAGRRRRCAVCVTVGALALPPDQLDALCAQTLASVANRALPLTCATADLVALADWCTRAVWATMGVLVVSTVIGVPPLFAAAATIAIALLVLCTKPLLIVAERAIPRMCHRAAQLADLDAVRVTNRPAPLARLLLTAATNRRSVASPWQIAHLWFDSDTVRPPRGTRHLQTWIDTREAPDSRAARRDSRNARAALLERADILVDMTGGDDALRAQLDGLRRA